MLMVAQGTKQSNLIIADIVQGAFTSKVVIWVFAGMRDKKIPQTHADLNFNLLEHSLLSNSNKTK